MLIYTVYVRFAAVLFALSRDIELLMLATDRNNNVHVPIAQLHITMAYFYLNLGSGQRKLGTCSTACSE